MRFLLPALALAIALPSVTAAQPTAQSSACAEDVADYCAAVEDGHGRLAACLYAHELVISDACYAAIAIEADMMDALFEGIHIAREQCTPDVAAHCSDAAPGEGRILACLARNADALSPGCADVMMVVADPLAAVPE